MAKKKITYMQDFTTNSQYILNNWPSFSAIVKKYGSSNKEETLESLHKTKVLEDAFNGGFSFFFRDLANLLVKIEQVLTVLRAVKEDSNSVTPDFLVQFDCSKIDVNKLTPAKVEKLRKKILTKISSLDTLLRKLHQAACDTILTHLREREVFVNENERHELSLIETRHSLIRRLDNLSLKPLKEEEVLSFGSYFHYKTAIILKNAFSRLEKRQGDNEVEQMLRKIKPCFDSIENEKSKFVAEYIQPLQKDLADALQVELR